ncbi:MAG: PLP-dependent aminotransferase family protein [Thermovirgaceae bacterium]
MSQQVWENLYSNVAKALKPSPIRELMKYTKKPGMISLAGGNPDPRIFPVPEFQEAAAIIGERGRDVLQYGTTGGYEPLKDFISEWMAPRMGRKVSSDELLITTGSQQVMDLFAAVLLNPGDAVVVEEPTYPGATHVLRNRQASFVTVPCDKDGMRVDLLPEKLDHAAAEGKKVKFIYSIVNFQNPSGYTLTAARRKELLAVASRYGIPILEDDPYGHLRFESEHEPTLFSMDTAGIVAYACSFSKILAPGTRVAWVVGPEHVIRKMVMVKQGSDLCTSTVSQAIVYEYCRLGHMETFLPKIIDHYRKKRDAMERAFRKHLPENALYETPEGGFFYWLTLPGIDSRELFSKAIDEGVAFVVGDAFFPNGGGAENVRTCFTFAAEDELDEAAQRLARAIEK